MQPFVRHQGVAASIPIDNVDTDQIIPSREMKQVSKNGLGEGLFAGWRYVYEGANKTGLQRDFVLNDPAYRDTSILLSGRNFGCGSSREHAVWALCEYGIRAIIAESFGRIFINNCARNGLLGIELPSEEIAILKRQVEADPQSNQILIDLEQGHVTAPGGEQFDFAVSESDRAMLLAGLDHIEFTLQYAADIDRFRDRRRAATPWAAL